MVDKNTRFDVHFFRIKGLLFKSEPYILENREHKKGQPMKKKTSFSKGLQKWMDGRKSARESNASFLQRVIKSKTLYEPFLDYILNHPRENKKNFKAICDSFKTRKEASAWFLNYGGFGHTYGKYLLKKWEEAQKPEDVIKWMPNFSPWALEERFNGIRIGAVPSDFVNEATFLDVLSDILRSEAVTNYLEIKRLEGKPEELAAKYPEVKKVDMFQMDERRDFMKSLLAKYCTKPFKIQKADKTYTVTFFCNPFSSKIVFKIDVQNGGTYIVKTLPYNFVNISSDRTRKEHENQAIRADSPFSNAMLEFYLKLNKSPHAPNILYYNYQYEIALYGQDTGTLYTFDDKPYALRDFHQFNTKLMKDANLLGVYINDISYGNFLIPENGGKLKIIDIGHASYANPLTPPVPGLCITLGNLCGREYLPHFGVFSL